MKNLTCTLDSLYALLSFSFFFLLSVWYSIEPLMVIYLCYTGWSGWTCRSYRFSTQGKLFYVKLCIKSFQYFKIFLQFIFGKKKQRVQKNLAILNKRTKGGCSCLCLLLSVIGIAVLVVALYMIIKYLWSHLPTVCSFLLCEVIWVLCLCDNISFYFFFLV